MKHLIYILVLITGLIVSSCNNDDDSVCEQWRVQEWVKEGNVYLSQPTTTDKTLCDDDIKPAGTTYVFYEKGSIKHYRKLIQKL